MRTRRQQFLTWLAVMAATALTGGCDEPVQTPEETTTNTTTGVTVSGSLVAAPNGADVPVRRSERLPRALPDDIMKVVELVESGAGEEVTRAYVATSPTPYDLSLEDVLYLRDIGISDGIIAAMMRRGGELRHQQAEAASLQTNLVAAVAEIKEALVAGTPLPSATEPPAPPAPEGEAPPPAPGDVTATAVAATAPPPQAVAATAAPADAPAEVQPFYQPLSPYGTWYEVPTYGWVWQPNVVVVNSTWAPYCHGGRWVWSDQGWYWCSDYSWGWAPFHYGRWCTYPGLGWCWVPGSVWGPSWVTWRHHGSYVGWAPLPPACGWSAGIGLTWYGSGVSVGFGFGLAPSCYTFVSYRNFCSRYPAHHAVGHKESTTIYQNSTVVNNVINGDNNTIINNGVGYDKVASLSRSEVPKARVQPLPEGGTQAVRVDRLERAKDGLVVYKPTPIAGDAGRPVALRSEVRPANAVSSAARPPVRTPASPPVRPNFESRFAGANPSSAASSKPVGERGGSVGSYAAPSAGSTPSPNLAGGRPSANYRQAATPSATATPKGVESRSGSPNSRSAVGAYSAAPASPGAVVGPRRQTTPVPLGDPSRNLPARVSTPSQGAYGATTAPAKPAAESRAGYSTATSSPQPQRYGAGAVPSYSTPAANRPTPGSYSSPAARSASPNLAPKVDYQRPSVSSSYRAPTAAPRSSSPVMAPTVAPVAPAAPRQSFSAPAPVISAPRPSSTPSFSAPAPSASRPSFSTPMPAPSIPSSRGTGNIRGQPN